VKGKDVEWKTLKKQLSGPRKLREGKALLFSFGHPGTFAAAAIWTLCDGLMA